METAGEAPDAPSGAPSVRPLPPRAVRLVVIALALVLTAMGFAATALTPRLAPDQPLLLLALESPIRNMLLARRVAPWPFLLVAVSRRTIAAVLFYFLGCWYGDRAVRWFEARAGHPAMVQRVERAVRTTALPMVFFFPSPLVSMLAGSMGMRAVPFVLFSTTGSLVIALACSFLGDVFAQPIDRVLGLFERHLLAISLVFVAMVLMGLWRMRRSLAVTPPPEG